MIRTGIAWSFLMAFCVGHALLHAQTSEPRRHSFNWKYYRPSPEKSVEIGNFYLARREYRAALSRYVQAIHSDSDYAPAYLGLGKAYEDMGQNKKALADYERYLAELPSDRDAAKAKGVHRAIKRLKRKLARTKAPERAGS